MKNHKPSYSENLDTLLALISFLAMTRYKSITPTALAKRLSLDKAEIITVLNTFTGIFRKSGTTNSKTNDYYYTLQLRYALRWKENSDQNNTDELPLPTEYLVTLLDFVSKMAQEERANENQRTSNTITIIAPSIAAVSGITAAIIAVTS